MKNIVLILMLALGARAESVEAHRYRLIQSMGHWALICPADTQDPALRGLADELGRLRRRADETEQPDRVAELQNDFEAWKNELSLELYGRYGHQDRLRSPKFRYALEEGLKGLAAVAEAPDAQKVQTGEVASRLSALRGLLDPAAADKAYDGAITNKGQGSFAAARLAKTEPKVFSGYVGRPRLLHPDQGIRPPTVHGAGSTDSDLIDYVSRHWGISPAYAKITVKLSKAFGVDPRLPLAMMRQESAGRCDAVSSAGASGLMQLMPDTARALGVSAAHIFDPYWNIWGGIKYIRQLSAQLAGYGYKGVQYVLAGYNAGPGAVIKYRGIPNYPETVDYVNKIRRNLRELKKA